jgi:hypothetical protein
MADELAIAWFPKSELFRALALWPDMIDWQFQGHDGYCRHIEDQLQEMAAAGAGAMSVAPIYLDSLIAWSEQHRVDPSDPESRARYAAELLAAGEAMPWPPGRRDPCWCGSGALYAECCGRPHALT